MSDYTNAKKQFERALAVKQAARRRATALPFEQKVERMLQLAADLRVLKAAHPALVSSPGDSGTVWTRATIEAPLNVTVQLPTTVCSDALNVGPSTVKGSGDQTPIAGGAPVTLVLTSVEPKPVSQQLRSLGVSGTSNRGEAVGKHGT